jgi:hypothetical protein
MRHMLSLKGLISFPGVIAGLTDYMASSYLEEGFNDNAVVIRA